MRKWTVLTIISLFLLTGGCTIITRNPEPGGPPAEAGSDKVAVCHKGKKTLWIDRAALKAHLGHGDTQGPCY